MILPKIKLVLFFFTSMFLFACSTQPPSNLELDTAECSNLEQLAKQEKYKTYELLAVSGYRNTAVFIQERLVARKLINQLDICIKSYSSKIVSAINYSENNAINSKNDVKTQIYLFNEINNAVKKCNDSEMGHKIDHVNPPSYEVMETCNLNREKFNRRLGNKFKMQFIKSIDSSLDAFKMAWTDEINRIVSTIGDRSKLRETINCKSYADPLSNRILMEADDDLYEIIDSPLFIAYSNCIK